MNSNRILLSISMLISGRDEMEKSLNSLLYFKNAFPTEIILVDTGCNAEQRELAERYADKIIDFTWCDDFAAARNTGLKEAHGEWFMYLDDDEWFENPQEIVHFFTTDEYKKYNSASYIVRNYLDIEGSLHIDSYPSRMVKLNKNIHFTGKVHEYLTPFDTPRKEFHDFVHHYGYAYKSDLERENHAQRNIKLLLEVRREHPGEPRWIMQLVQEYFVVCDYEKVIAAGTEGLKEWEKNRQHLTYMPIHIGTIYAYIMLAYEYLDKYEEEEKILQKALSEPFNKMDTMEVCIAFYDMIGARVYSYLENYELCLTCLRKYRERYDNLKDDRIVMETKTSGIVTDVFNDMLFAETILICLPVLIQQREWRQIQQLILTIDWSKKDYFLDETKIKKILDALCCVEYCSTSTDLIQKIVGESDKIHELYHLECSLEKKYTEEGKEKEIQNLHHIIATLSNDHFDIIASKILWKNDQKSNNLEIYYQQIFQKYLENIFKVNKKIWKIAEEREIEVDALLITSDYRAWRRAVVNMEHYASSEEWEEWNCIIQRWKKRDDIRYELFTIKYMEHYLMRKAKKAEDLSDIEEIIWAYADKVFDFFAPYYRAEVLEQNFVGLPDELQLALELKKMHIYRKSGQESNILECMKKCLGVYPKLDKTMLVYAEMLRDEIQRKNAEVTVARRELLRMADSLKTMAKIQISQKNIDAAKQILLQIQQYIPDDVEIKDILKQLDESD